MLSSLRRSSACSAADDAFGVFDPNTKAVNKLYLAAMRRHDTLRDQVAATRGCNPAPQQRFHEAGAKLCDAARASCHAPRGKKLTAEQRKKCIAAREARVDKQPWLVHKRPRPGAAGFQPPRQVPTPAAAADRVEEEFEQQCKEREAAHADDSESPIA